MGRDSHGGSDMHCLVVSAILVSPTHIQSRISACILCPESVVHFPGFPIRRNSRLAGGLETRVPHHRKSLAHPSPAGFFLGSVPPPRGVPPPATLGPAEGRAKIFWILFLVQKNSPIPPSQRSLSLLAPPSPWASVPVLCQQTYLFAASIGRGFFLPPLECPTERDPCG